MATTTFSNHFLYQLADKQVDLSADTLKVVLMDTSFTFDKDSDATLADVSANEIASGNGYTQQDKTITGAALAEDDTNDAAAFTCNQISWSASGGEIGPFQSFIVYDDTTADDTVVLCHTLDASVTLADGYSFDINDFQIDLGHG